jgi:riboflavin synthase
MFTGLVETMGKIAAAERGEEGTRLTISSDLAAELSPGDSVAVNGVCLTAAACEPGQFSADVMNETLGRTSLGPLEAGELVNLELPLKAGEPLGGHIVQGHVDGTGSIAAVEDDGFSTSVRVRLPAEILRFIAEKGSVAIDGVSLTVAGVGDDWFSVALIPETRERTTLGSVEPGREVNIEVDVLAKYVERLVART